MTSFADALYAALIADAEIASTIGTRIDPSASGEGVPNPRIVYEQISSEHIGHLQGPSGLVNAQWALVCYADTPPQARSVIDRVRRLLDRYRGDLGGVGINVRSLSVGEIVETFAPPVDESDRGSYAAGIELNVWHRESVGV
jgi:hypothetical protein